MAKHNIAIYQTPRLSLDVGLLSPSICRHTCMEVPEIRQGLVPICSIVCTDPIREIEEYYPTRRCYQSCCSWYVINAVEQEIMVGYFFNGAVRRRRKMGDIISDLQIQRGSRTGLQRGGMLGRIGSANEVNAKAERHHFHQSA